MEILLRNLPQLLLRPNENSITRWASRDDAMVNKKGETRLHLALFTGALVLEDNATQGSQDNPSEPPLVPSQKRKIKTKAHNKACSAALEKGEWE